MAIRNYFMIFFLTISTSLLPLSQNRRFCKYISIDRNETPRVARVYSNFSNKRSLKITVQGGTFSKKNKRTSHW